MGENKKSHILIVDDQELFRKSLSNILEHKYTLSTAKTGQMALDKAKEVLPDLILLDVVMPDMSGFDVLASLKDSDETRSIPVIFITSRDCVEDEERGFALGAMDYITKPFHNSIVEARVRTHIQMIEYIRTIEHMCMIDAMTNIANRRYFESQLEAEWDRAVRDKTELSMLMIDLDKFKNYNDKYGHPQGDILLQTIAAILEREVNRPADFVARWGGEEFAVLLPGSDLKGALDVAERIRSSIEKTVIPYSDGTGTKIAVSVGVCSKIPASGGVKEDIVSGADIALYAAKRAGGNGVCFSNR